MYLSYNTAFEGKFWIVGFERNCWDTADATWGGALHHKFMTPQYWDRQARRQVRARSRTARHDWVRLPFIVCHEFGRKHHHFNLSRF